jgi:hypothetical protein
MLESYPIDTRLSRGSTWGMDKKQRTIRLTSQDLQAIAAIRERYGLTSASSAIRFALHTIWREFRQPPSPTPKKERRSHPADVHAGGESVISRAALIKRCSSSYVRGPGFPFPMTWSSICTTGTISFAEEVTKASSA